MARAKLDPLSVVDGDCSPAMDLSRSKLAQRGLAVCTIPLTCFRQWDHHAVNLPETPASDDLGLVTGTLGTNPPTIQAGDLKTAGATTRYAGAEITLPPDYEAGESVTIRIWAGMKTAVADASCTVDLQAYLLQKDLSAPVDQCVTTLQNMNSLTFASFDFTITPTSLEAGDVLQIRLVITCTDAAGGSAVIPTISQVELLADLR